MNSGICIYMNGAKCAGKFCDFWNHEEQVCSPALESKMRAEIYGAALGQMREDTLSKEEAEILQRAARHLNVVEGPLTKQ